LDVAIAVVHERLTFPEEPEIVNQALIGSPPEDWEAHSLAPPISAGRAGAMTQGRNRRGAATAACVIMAARLKTKSAMEMMTKNINASELPKKDWRASEGFVDLKLSHWIQILLTLALVSVGLAQVFVYLRQAHIMRAQTDIGGRQVDIMREQIGEMRQQRLSAQAQMRADMRRETLQTEHKNIGGRDRWMITPVWKNAGSTDARYLGAAWRLKWLADANIPPDQLLCPNVEPVTNASGISAPGQMFLQGAQVLPAAVVDAAAVNRAVIIIAGRVQYRDVFPDTPLHYLEWCVWAVPNDPSHNVWSFISLYERGD
jgi:hypothetical protein